MTLPDLSEVLDIIGMIGFALAGLLATRGRRMDPVGVFVATFTTAFGGGIVRDIMLDLRPFYWMSHPQWVWLAATLTLFAPTIIRRLQDRWQNAIYIAADAVGLAFFSIGSTITALNTGANNTTSIVIGVTTGVFGGLLRDVFLNRVPAVLSDKTPYASAAFLGCLLYVSFIPLGLEPVTLSVGCGLLIFFIRVLTYAWGIQAISYRALGRLTRGFSFPEVASGLLWPTFKNDNDNANARPTQPRPTPFSQPSRRTRALLRQGGNTRGRARKRL